MEGERPEERLDFGSLERLSANAPPPKEPSTFVPKLLGTIAFLAVAAVVVAVPWYFLTRPAGPTPTASTTPTQSASPSPSPSPMPSLGAGVYEVVGVDNCANVRSAPGLGSPVIDCLTLGVRVSSDGKSEDLGGITWIHVADPFKKGAEAWMAAQYLKKVE